MKRLTNNPCLHIKNVIIPVTAIIPPEFLNESPGELWSALDCVNLILKEVEDESDAVMI